MSIPCFWYYRAELRQSHWEKLGEGYTAPLCTIFPRNRLLFQNKKVFLKKTQNKSGFVCTKDSTFSHGPSKGAPKDPGDNPSVLVLWVQTSVNSHSYFFMSLWTDTESAMPKYTVMNLWYKMGATARECPKLLLSFTMPSSPALAHNWSFLQASASTGRKGGEARAGGG